MEVLIAGLVVCAVGCAVGCAVVGRSFLRGRPRSSEGVDSPRVERDSGLERMEEGVQSLDRRLESLEERVDFSEEILMDRRKEERSKEDR